MVARAHTLIENYKENGVKSDRILIRLPATWQGIQAAKQLESEGIAAHVTLIYRYFIVVVANISDIAIMHVHRASADSVQWQTLTTVI